MSHCSFLSSFPPFVSLCCCVADGAWLFYVWLCKIKYITIELRVLISRWILAGVRAAAVVTMQLAGEEGDQALAESRAAKGKGVAENL